MKKDRTDLRRMRELRALNHFLSTIGGPDRIMDHRLRNQGAPALTRGECLLCGSKSRGRRKPRWKRIGFWLCRKCQLDTRFLKAYNTFLRAFHPRIEQPATFYGETRDGRRTEELSDFEEVAKRLEKAGGGAVFVREGDKPPQMQYLVTDDGEKVQTDDGREILFRMEGVTTRFQATFMRFGCTKSDGEVANKTALLGNVRCVGEDRILVDHIWLTDADQLESLSLVEGDIIRFNAHVEPYERFVWVHNGHYQSLRLSWGLTNPSIIQKMTPESAMLWEQNRDISAFPDDEVNTRVA